MAGDGALFFTGSIAGGANQLYMTSGEVGAPRSLGNLPGFGVFPSRSILLQGMPLMAFDEASRGVEPYLLRNVKPVAVADTASVTSGANVLVNVRANDIDTDSSAADLAVSIVSAPTNGTAVIDAGSIRYTPASGFTGSDTFQYRLTDELGSQSTPVTVTMTVNAAPAGGGGGSGGGGGGGGGGGALDFMFLALLTAASYHRSRGLFSRR
jgi:hypothetical protein